MFVPCVLQTGRWNDVSCSELNTFICKMAKAHYPLPSVKPTVYGCPQVGKTYVTNSCIHLHSQSVFNKALPRSDASGLGRVRILLLLDGGDGQELVRCQTVLQSAGQLLGAHRRPVSNNRHTFKKKKNHNRKISFLLIFDFYCCDLCSPSGRILAGPLYHVYHLKTVSNNVSMCIPLQV